jgi:hypothetical protein
MLPGMLCAVADTKMTKSAGEHWVRRSDSR